MINCIIVIPVYKEAPNDFEIRSFIQVLTVLGRYPVVLLTYPGFNLQAYLELALGLQVEVRVEYFNKEYFESLNGYNKLCLGSKLYHRFSEYKYMLIYQLDAFVFNDQLESWCEKEYDYIGAPWFDDNQSHESGAKLWAVGNGGFSLRKIQTFIDLFSTDKSVYSFKSLYKRSKKNGLVWLFNAYFLKKENTLTYLIDSWTDAEDLFYCLKLADTNLSLRIPPITEAIKFAFEQSPEYLFSLNNNELPFGCHGWPKYDYKTFWCKMIK